MNSLASASIGTWSLDVRRSRTWKSAGRKNIPGNRESKRGVITRAIQYA
jgi:hypothetical protein